MVNEFVPACTLLGLILLRFNSSALEFGGCCFKVRFSWFFE